MKFAVMKFALGENSLYMYFVLPVQFSNYIFYFGSLCTLIKVDEEKVIFKEEQKNILQVMLYDDKRKSLFISKGQLISECAYWCLPIDQKPTKNS